ncbi:Endothelial PAS domain-containing protein 1 [Chionoecetes opilio]|uniref:Endothelial PAS domain-containing protein 1 n=1 Tax=Chionoecetes opilio TaxID=41210 RepID=A0A8J4YS57_CHIOP|nr:Endothelial PAS domain-containing protein 1 [Chionoecetes opilio]
MSDSRGLGSSLSTPFMPVTCMPWCSDRNSDKRKEQSRNAARSRRDKETKIFNELSSVLPIPPQTLAQLDKASVMRLTIANLQLHSVCETGLTKRIPGLGGGKLDLEMDEHHLKALDGFLLVVSTDGRVIYTSENIVTFLGHHQVHRVLFSLFPAGMSLEGGVGGTGEKSSFYAIRFS